MEFAKAILGSPVLSADLSRWRPEGGGRAVSFGLLCHATHLAGATLYLPHPEVLPLRDVPIVGALSDRSTDEDFRILVAIARECGGALDLDLPDTSVGTIRRVAERLRIPMGTVPFPMSAPLVLLVSRNVGKALGSYLSDWGRGVHRAGVVILDEVDHTDACYLHVGTMRDRAVPVSFYGIK